MDCSCYLIDILSTGTSCCCNRFFYIIWIKVYFNLFRFREVQRQLQLMCECDLVFQLQEHALTWWVPLSNPRFVHTPSPAMQIVITVLEPYPISSTVQPRIGSKTPVHFYKVVCPESVASSPPTPARTSRMTEPTACSSAVTSCF